MPGATSDLPRTRLTVDCFTVAGSHVRAERNLIAAVAETAGVLGTTEEGMVKARGEVDF